MAGVITPYAAYELVAALKKECGDEVKFDKKEMEHVIANLDLATLDPDLGRRLAAAEGIRTDIQRAVDNRMAAQDWETLNASWRETLERLAKEFVCGEAQVDPRSAASCEHCGLQPLCRISAADTTGENAR